MGVGDELESSSLVNQATAAERCATSRGDATSLQNAFLHESRLLNIKKQGITWLLLKVMWTKNLAWRMGISGRYLTYAPELSLSDAHILKFALEAAIHSVSRGLKPCHWQKLTITCSN